MRSSTRWQTRSPSAASRASRAWSAPSRSRTPSVCRALLMKRGIEHEILNAKQHEREAHIVAQAGRKGAVTIATNMAGRGTDIILGGNPEFTGRRAARPNGASRPKKRPRSSRPRRSCGQAILCEDEHVEVVEAGGLAVIGTERHDSRRIDNQLRGTLRTSGRSRALAVLPLARRRPHAPVRRRSHGAHLQR